MDLKTFMKPSHDIPNFAHFIEELFGFAEDEWNIFHINLRILLINLLALLLFRSFVTLFRSSSFIYRMVAYKDPCLFLMNSIKCSILSSFGSAPVKCLAYAFIAITIERFLAMCFYQRYEKWKYPVALAFIPLTWFEFAMEMKSTALKFHKLMTLYESQKKYKSYCSSITSNPIPYLKLVLEIPVLIGILFLLLLTRIISKRKMILQMRASVDTLSSRYQIWENMKTSKTMFIATIMFIISSSFNLSGTLLLMYFPPSDFLNFAVFKEIKSLALTVFINAISILFIIRVEQMHNKTIKRLLNFGCCPSNKVGDEQTNQPLSGRQHIEIIEQMWEKEIRK
uniref:G-protein coupled receptors family 1 profile domain-containing protein n=2 Tax=Wuchereria bancrofti TaxID=6293 RepID=A0A1I8EFD3_WUCBA